MSSIVDKKNEKSDKYNEEKELGHLYHRPRQKQKAGDVTQSYLISEDYI